MAKGGRGGKGGGGGGGTSRLAQGEEAYVRMTPNWLHKDGEVVVAKTADGSYIYKVGFDKNVSQIDKNSAEYKQALRNYNVNAKFNADGSVTVTKGGLYDKKRTFKSVGAFQNETVKRLDNYQNYYKNQADRVRQGRISQIEADNLKSDIRNNQPNALRNFNNHLQKSIRSSETQAAAAQDMKARLNVAISNIKK